MPQTKNYGTVGIVYFSEMMLPFTADQNSPTYCGVLLCLRHIVPHLGKEEQESEVVMRGSFGVIHQKKQDSNEEMLEKEEKQLLQVIDFASNLLYNACTVLILLYLLKGIRILLYLGRTYITIPWSYVYYYTF